MTAQVIVPGRGPRPTSSAGEPLRDGSTTSSTSRAQDSDCATDDRYPRAMERLAASVVLGLGTLLLIGGVVGFVNGVRGHDVVDPLPRLLFMLLVVLAMRRAAPMLRRAPSA